MDWLRRKTDFDFSIQRFSSTLLFRSSSLILYVSLLRGLQALRTSLSLRLPRNHVFTFLRKSIPRQSKHSHLHKLIRRLREQQGVVGGEEWEKVSCLALNVLFRLFWRNQIHWISPAFWRSSASISTAAILLLS